MINKLMSIISSSDEEIETRIAHRLAHLGYSVAHSPGNFVFGTPPDTDSAFIPVLVSSHWDTRRNALAEVALESIDGDILYNANGIMGADDRAGVAAVLYIACAYKEKPLVLFTNYEESGMAGMKEFLKSGLFDSWCDQVNLVISADRRGDNDIVCAGARPGIPHGLLHLAEAAGYNFVPGIFTDTYLLEDSYNIAAVNVSMGFFNQHTVHEYLSVETWIQCAVRLKRFIETVSDKYSPVPWPARIETKRNAWDYDVTYTVDSVDGPRRIYAPSPACDICGRADRDVTFDELAQVFVCYACHNRIERNYRTTLNKNNIRQIMQNLTEERDRTRRANRVHAACKSERLPICPSCRTNEHVVWHEPSSSYVCTSCMGRDEKSHTGFDGRFWKIFNKKLRMKQLMWIQDSTVVRHNIRLEGPVMSMNTLVSEKLLVQCAVCKRHVKRHYVVDTQKGSTVRPVCVCPECTAELAAHQSGPNDFIAPAQITGIRIDRVTHGSEDSKEAPF